MNDTTPASHRFSPTDLANPYNAEAQEAVNAMHPPVDPAFPEDVPVEPVYHVAESARLGSWYIADQSGEPVSGLYDTEAEAADALTAQGGW
jgi:hypothetical protein